MKKNKGFTLMELIVAMALLVFVFLFSAALFDQAIQGTPKLRNTIAKNSDTLSAMEDGIIDVKEAYIYNQRAVKNPADKPKNYDKIDGLNTTTGQPEKGAPINVDVSGIFNITPPNGGGSVSVNTIKGYFVSMDSKTNTIVYNNPNTTDTTFTFVSTGYKESPTASIDNMAIDQGGRFFYLPKADVPGGTPTSIRVDYNIKHDGNESKLQLSRLRFLVSPITFNSNIYSYFHDGYNKNIFPFTVSPDTFGFIDKEYDSNSKSSISATYTVPTYASDKAGYINTIDRDFAAEAVTFNLNGRTGAKNSTFSNQDKNKQNVIHYIGLPYVKNLDVHIDPNLAIARSKSEQNKYYSLFDVDNNTDTNYGNAMTQKGTIYDFTWGNNDVRNFLDIGTRVSGAIVVPNGFMQEVVVKDTEGIDKKLPDITKPYGNTLYYKMMNAANSITFPAGGGGDKTIFIKFNARNYYDRFGSSQKFPYSLLSYNYDYNTGDLLAGETQGFLLFVDSDGKIKSALFNKAGNPIIKEEGNINDTKLYTDESGQFIFDSLEYDKKIGTKRDEREDFNIMAIDKRGGTVYVHLLYRDSAKRIATRAKKIFTFNDSDMSKAFTFGQSVKLLKNSTGAIDTVLNSNVEPVLEIADILAYSTSYTDKDVENTMNYLYRKYLTLKERGEDGKFDSWYLSKY
ncbi:prepilin-type cleavage/methylation N-terminal domain protein [[Eubacterium] yurii subsp. margaretiae ATCC 43715]|nr:prepilin-type cleavage/methylation N-terminal domain protein [[Eubacterium] yurii subsp. margaretiae ATCC 43715]